MTFALSWEADNIQAGGFIYLDAVLTWNRNFTGQVSKHPIDGGASLTDAYINNNPVFSLSAVISGSDISLTPAFTVDENGTQPFNTRPAPSEVEVRSTDASTLTKFIPNVISQFIPDLLPEIVMDDFRSNSIEEVQDILINLQSGEGYSQLTGQFETAIRPVTLYETDGFLSLIKKLPSDETKALVITSVSFREDTESGYCLYADITLEQIRFANLKKVQLPPDLVQPVVKKKVTSKKSLGKCDSTQKDTSTSTDTSKSTSIDELRNNTTGIIPL